MGGQGVNLTFAQRQAIKRLEDLKNLDEPAPPMLESLVKQVPNHDDKRQNRPRGVTNEQREEQERAMAESRKAEDRKRLEMFEMRKRERAIATEERRRSVEESAERESDYKAQVAQECQSKERQRRELSKELETMIPAREREHTFGDPALPVEKEVSQLPRTHKIAHAEIDKKFEAANKNNVVSDDASSTLSSSSKLSVDAQVALLTNQAKELAGDYSRYLPDGLGRKPISVGSPTYAQLTLARRRGVTLRKRREAVQVIERLVGMSEVRPVRAEV